MKPLPIPKLLTWILLIAGWMALILGYILALTQPAPTSGSITLMVGITFHGVIWLVLMVDSLRHPLYQKTFWIVLFILLPNLAPFGYLPLRGKLIDMGIRREGKMDFKAKQREVGEKTR